MLRWENGGLLEPPFSYDELYRVLLRIVPEAEAVELARTASSSVAEHGPVHRRRGLAYESVSDVWLSNDTLILLSLESDELRARVEEHRYATRGEQSESATERAEWERRHAELKAWADSGYR